MAGLNRAMLRCIKMSVRLSVTLRDYLDASTVINSVIIMCRSQSPLAHI